MSCEALVSICIPTYNRAGMIPKAIESALGQTYKNIEVIVIDNASTDTTAVIVASYHDNRLKYVHNERNLGLFGNFNRCIELATGDFLHILHSDDYIDPEFTARCISFFQDNPSVVMTSTRACIIGENFKKDIPHCTGDQVYRAPDGFRHLLTTRSFISCPSVIVRRDIYQKVGLFSLEYPYSSDLYQWMKIARIYDIGFVSDACVFYRQGEHSESFRFLFSSPQGYLDMIRIFIQLALDLGEERIQFADELLTAQRRFTYDCLFAGFTRSETMPDFSPAVFSGLSFMCWTLEKPTSLAGWGTKFWDLTVILFSGLLISWSVSQKMIRQLFFSHTEGY